MAKSKHRKKQVADSRKLLEKAKKKHKILNSSLNESRRRSLELDKENIGNVRYESSGKGNELQMVPCDENSGWLSGVYGWCQAGISSVVTQVSHLQLDQIIEV